jgi:hypothetical protein
MYGFALLSRLFNASSFSVWPVEASDRVTADLMDRAERTQRSDPAEASALRFAAQNWLAATTSR